MSVITPEKPRLNSQTRKWCLIWAKTPGIKAAHPKGFSLLVGSGLAYIGEDGNGGKLFWGITDRGPNADSPDYLDAGGASSKSKVFPRPSFAPKIAKILLKDGQAVVLEVIDLKTDTGLSMSGPARAPWHDRQ